LEADPQHLGLGINIDLRKCDPFDAPRCRPRDSLGGAWHGSGHRDLPSARPSSLDARGLLEHKRRFCDPRLPDLARIRPIWRTRPASTASVPRRSCRLARHEAADLGNGRATRGRMATADFAASKAGSALEVDGNQGQRHSHAKEVSHALRAFSGIFTSAETAGGRCRHLDPRDERRLAEFARISLRGSRRSHARFVFPSTESTATLASISCPQAAPALGLSLARRRQEHPPEATHGRLQPCQLRRGDQSAPRRAEDEFELPRVTTTRHRGAPAAPPLRLAATARALPAPMHITTATSQHAARSKTIAHRLDLLAIMASSVWSLPLSIDLLRRALSRRWCGCQSAPLAGARAAKGQSRERFTRAHRPATAGQNSDRLVRGHRPRLLFFAGLCALPTARQAAATPGRPAAGRARQQARHHGGRAGPCERQGRLGPNRRCTRCRLHCLRWERPAVRLRLLPAA